MGCSNDALRTWSVRLTCAALLMPCVSVAEWGGPVDAPTEKNRVWLARWVDQPGAEWVREIYRRHRASEGSEDCTRSAV